MTMFDQAAGGTPRPVVPSAGHSHDRLLVIGAGAKAIALAAKAQVLRELGHPVPEVLVVESSAVAASWRATGSLTSGDQELGTPPEKDIGFPYIASQVWDDAGVSDTEMLSRFSWGRYLIETQQFAGWIDRGRPNPSHHTWAKYLAWAADRAEMHIVFGTVTGLEIHDGAWSARVNSQTDGPVVISAAGLVVTGYGNHPATAFANPRVPRQPTRRLSVPDFWHLAGEGALPPGHRVMVVGSGEAAAAVTEYLLRTRQYEVSVVCPWHTLYSRGESLFENEIYSNPARWQRLSPNARREFISRTDRGVFSQKVLASMAHLGQVEIIGGRVVDVRRSDPDDSLRVVVNAGTEQNVYLADLVVAATGRNAAWFTKLFGPHAQATVAGALGGVLNGPALSRAVGHDLSITGIRPRLHVPNLAGPAQGPGFPGLSCLGLLADRILATYAHRSVATAPVERVPVASGRL